MVSYFKESVEEADEKFYVKCMAKIADQKKNDSSQGADNTIKKSPKKDQVRISGSGNRLEEILPSASRADKQDKRQSCLEIPTVIEYMEELPIKISEKKLET